LTTEFTLQHGRFLTSLARNVIEAYLKTGVKPTPPEGTPERLRMKCGVFVTLNRVEDGRESLRGCIGYPYPSHPLVEATVNSAIDAATGDPRFAPVSLEEMDEIAVEVSILTPPERISVTEPSMYPSEIRIGRDGLVIERGWHKGLLLPQVPVEWEWDEEEFLGNCCIKAGLSPDCWLLEDTKVYRFSAVVFKEEKPHGNVKKLTLPGK